MNATQMKRFRERIEEKAAAARTDLKASPNEEKVAFLRKVSRNAANRLIQSLTLVRAHAWSNGCHQSDQAEAWLTKDVQRRFEAIGKTDAKAKQIAAIDKAMNDAIDQVTFLADAEALVALKTFEKTLKKILS